MRSIRPLLAATGLAAALALTATACGPTEDKATDKPTAAASDAAKPAGDQGNGDIALPKDIADKLKEHGVDPEKWKNGEWQNWDKDKWLREAKDFVNPVIAGLWKPERMRTASDPAKTMAAGDLSGGQGLSDPDPRPVRAVPEKTPYTRHGAPVGKLFFDSPKGHMVCSGTVIKDVNNPGKSNLVWTAGHCVHAGAAGGWYRNLTFVPAYNNNGKSPAALQNAPYEEHAPYGAFWADWASTSGEWIRDGGPTGGTGAPYDYAVLHVKPENGSGKSLEETVGAAIAVDFQAPDTRRIGSMGAWGYPQGPPYNGVIMHKCIDRPNRLSISSTTPTMHRIGCTMTGGSSGGGWFMAKPNGQLALVSNTSIGPVTHEWLAGPRLGPGAQQIYTMMSKKYGSR
ncbi:trypsin-like serine peptidase [Streptomyces sp. NPDC004111]|uniref:trypsin-like serine peptidase n=1 Tax=Streptomyces sp. NPDC004111 TaxID=3364690 RepID=UPI00369DD7CE